MFVAEIDQGVTARRAARQRHAQLPPGAGDRKRPGQDLLRQRDARDAFDAALHPAQPVRLRRRCSRASALQPVPVDPRELRRAQEVFREESPKSFVIDLGDLSRDAVVAAARPGRLPRRDADAPLRHADLRAVGHRSRRHHALRSQAPPQHRALRVEGEAGAARAASTTKTTSSTTTSSTTTSTSRRRRIASGSTAARASASRCASYVARHADAPARRSAGRPVDRQLRVRPAVRHPRQEPEHAGRQPADAAARATAS